MPHSWPSAGAASPWIAHLASNRLPAGQITWCHVKDSSPHGATVPRRDRLEPLRVLVAPDVPEPPPDDRLGKGVVQGHLTPGPAPQPVSLRVQGSARAPRAGGPRFRALSRARLSPSLPP